MKATMTQLDGPKSVRSGFTYHEDGSSWFKEGRDHSGHKRRESPLSDFHGARTISDPAGSARVGFGRNAAIIPGLRAVSDDVAPLCSAAVLAARGFAGSRRWQRVVGHTACGVSGGVPGGQS